MTVAGILLLGVLLVLPGPGWLVIAIGLTVLARDVAWAERVLARVRRRLPAGADGRLSRPVVATMVTAGLASTAVMLWWTL
ncbi:MAG: PGPGW domain-containing protein [Acidimicrobiia bacterium]